MLKRVDVLFVYLNSRKESDYKFFLFSFDEFPLLSTQFNEVYGLTSEKYETILRLSGSIQCICVQKKVISIQILYKKQIEDEHSFTDHSSCACFSFNQHPL